MFPIKFEFTDIHLNNNNKEKQAKFIIIIMYESSIKNMLKKQHTALVVDTCEANVKGWPAKNNKNDPSYLVICIAAHYIDNTFLTRHTLAIIKTTQKSCRF